MKNFLIKAKYTLKGLGKALGHHKTAVLLIFAAVAAIAGWSFYQYSVNQAWVKAEDYYKRADYDKTAKILNNVSLPGDAERLDVYAKTMQATRQLDKSLKANKALYEQKKDPAVKNVIGNLYNEKKEYSEAEKVYEELISSNPTYVQAYVNLATMQKLQNHNDQAIEVASRGVKNNPNNVVLAELMVSLTMTDKQSAEYQQAITKLQEINPQDQLLEIVNKQ